MDTVLAPMCVYAEKYDLIVMRDQHYGKSDVLLVNGKSSVESMHLCKRQR